MVRRKVEHNSVVAVQVEAKLGRRTYTTLSAYLQDLQELLVPKHHLFWKEIRGRFQTANQTAVDFIQNVKETALRYWVPFPDNLNDFETIIATMSSKHRNFMSAQVRGMYNSAELAGPDALSKVSFVTLETVGCGIRHKLHIWTNTATLSNPSSTSYSS